MKMVEDDFVQIVIKRTGQGSECDELRVESVSMFLCKKKVQTRTVRVVTM
jgi:hypothetical protein